MAKLTSPVPESEQVKKKPFWEIAPEWINQKFGALNRSLNDKLTSSYVVEADKPQPAGQVAGLNTAAPTPTNMPTPTAMPTPTMTPPAFPNTTQYSDESQRFLEDVILPITRQYGIPDAVAAGQFGAEGRLGGKYAGRNNYFNIHAYDSNSDSAYSYDTPEAGIEAYARLLSEDPKNLGYDDAIKLSDALQAMIAIQNAGYAGDPATYTQRAKNNYPSYSAFIQDTPEWKKYYK
jgi:flagellum-specific peptidoglycan hydrolase FlgJ